jgi:hypothetical protein
MTQPELLLSIDLHRVGPPPAEDATAWWFAVKIGSALAGDPPDQEARETALPSLLPWNFLPSATGFRLIELTDQATPLDILIAEEAAERLTFHDRLRERFVENALALLREQKLSLTWRREGDAEPDKVVEEGDEEGIKTLATLARPWLGLSSSLAALPPPISEPLRARNMIKIEGGYLEAVLAQAQVRELGPIVIVPEQVMRFSDKQLFKLVPPQHQRWADEKPIELVYENEKHPGDRVLAYAYPLPLSDPEVRLEADAYWLHVEDSRDDTLADIDKIIKTNADPAVFAALLSAELLCKVLVDRTDATKRATASEAAAYKTALESWAAESKAGSTIAEAIYGAVAAETGEAGNSGLAQALSAKITDWLRAEPFPDGAEVLRRFHPEEELSEGLKALLEPFFRTSKVKKPVLPGEGIDFLIGDASTRVVGERATEPNKRSGANERAEYGVLVRRATGQLQNAPWRVVTAGVPVIDENHLLLKQPWGSPETLALPHLKQIMPRGIALAYDDGLLRNDDCYQGRLMIGQPGLARVHAESNTQDGIGDALGDLNALSFGSGAFFMDAEADNRWGLAPALHYGDKYQLAAFVIDRGGGIPTEIARDGEPWRLDLSKLDDHEIRSSPEIEFKRRVPLGDMNVRPLQRDKKFPNKPAWPAIDPSVRLRSAEWLAAQPKSGPTPEKPEDAAKAPANRVPTALLSAGLVPEDVLPSLVSFEVEPPRLDEHTFQRWCVPPTSGPTPEDCTLDELVTELSRIFDQRARHLAAGRQDPKFENLPDFLPHDPSVWGVAYTVTLVDEDGTEAAGPIRLAPFEPTANRFLRKPLAFCVRSNSKPAPHGTIDLGHLEPGQFARVTIDLLVKPTDGARFDREALGYTAPLEALNDAGQTRSFYRHPGETFLVETITDKLPEENELYAGFSLKVDEAGRIIASFDKKLRHIDFVDGLELERQRWVWRNLPNVVDSTAGDVDERRLCSGLPLDLADSDQNARDSSDAVLTFDARAALDTGFVQRSLVRGSWPRDQKGRPSASATLHIDDRDGQAGADYLRYALTAVSRYAPYLGEAERKAAPAEDAQFPDYAKVRGPWRRVAARYRGGDRLRPLNILAVLPLTAAPSQLPGSGVTPPNAEQATPFLVLLDEIWFREYGPGEALMAELALEDREIDGSGNEGAGKPRPFRFGPLPHKHVKRREVNLEEQTDEIDPEFTRHHLTCFGPFGYTLDRSGNEALANATAFVVYIPNALKVGPHWSVGVRFRRALYGVHSGGEATKPVLGPLSGTHLLYTIADSGKLADVPAGSPVRVKTENGVPQTLVPGAGSFDLHPYRRDGDAPDERIQRQYRYLLLIGSAGWDGGRGVEVLLPAMAAWVEPDLSLRALKESDKLPSADQLRGQILEIELSGAFPSKLHGGTSSPIEGADSLAALFRDHLLSGSSDIDAGGRVGRISEVFKLSADP